MRRELAKIYVEVNLAELKNLMFWAKYGLENASSGQGIEACVQTINRLDKENKLQVGKPIIGLWR